MSLLKNNSYSFKKFSKNTWSKRLFGRTPYQKILRIYGLVVLVGAILLYLPISRADSSNSFNFFDSCFTSVSAFTNTGLTTHTTSSTFNFFGQFVIVFLIQIGGMGFMTLLIFLWIFINKTNFNIEQRWFLHFERGSHKKVEALPVVKTGILFLLFTEFVGAILLTIFFYFATPLSGVDNGNVDHLKGNFLKSLWAGIFHSISATNNAGFDILGSKSIMSYRNEFNNILSFILLIESFIGGIGYPVFYDVYIWMKNKKNNKPTRFSLFSKIAISSYLTVAYLSFLLALLFEGILGFNSENSLFFSSNSKNNKWGTQEFANKVWNLTYITFSSRSAGFASLDTKDLTEPTKWLLTILMFIGTSPASTGGGIRTITVFIIFKKMLQMASGRKHLSIYKKTIDQKLVFEAWNVFVLSVILLVISSFLVMASLPGDKKNSVGDVIFESSSAFGTAGLSSGVTTDSGFLGKIVLMLLMFIGQMGISNALISVTDLKPKDNLQYCAENLRIS